MNRFLQAWKDLTALPAWPERGIQAAEKAYGDSAAEEQISAWFGGGIAADGSPAGIEDFVVIPTVFRAVTRLGYDLASGPIVIEQRSGKDWLPVERGDDTFGDVAGVFERANPTEGRTSLWARFHIGMETSRGGTGYLFTDYLNEGQPVSPGDTPKELRVLRPDGVTQVWGSARQIFEGPVQFKYSERGAMLNLRPDEVMMHCYPSPRGQFEGLSPIQAACMDARIEKALAHYQQEFFLNGARGSVAVLSEKIMGEDQRNEFREAWQENQATLGKRHGLWLLAGGLKLQELNGRRDTDFVDLHKIVKQQISMVFGVPPALLSDYGDSGIRANLEEQTPIYVDGTLDPKWTLLEQNLTEVVLPRFMPPGMDPDTLRARIDRDKVPMIQRMMLDRVKVFSMAVGGPFMTPDEAREQMKMKPMADGSGKGLNTSAGAGLIGPGPAEATAKRAPRLATKAAGKLASDPERHTRRVLRAAMFDRLEGPAIVKVHAYFDARRDAMLARLPAMKALATKDIFDDLFEDEEERAAARELVLEITSAITHRRGPQAFAEVGGAPGRFMVDDPAIVQFLTSNAYADGVLIAQTSATLLREILVNASQGTIQDMATAIASAYDVRRSSALTIARTETVRAHNATTDLAWAQTGLVLASIWLTANDDVVRSIASGDAFDHTQMDGVQALMGEDFEVPGENGPDFVRFPGDPKGDPANIINCRCSRDPVTKDTAGKGFVVADDLEKILAGIA